MIKKTSLTAPVIAATMFLALTTSTTHADIISINMLSDGNNHVPVPLASTDVAGVAPAANWNNIGPVYPGSPVALNLSDGTASGASVNWSAGDYLNSNPGDGSPNYTMMNEWFSFYSNHYVTVGDLPTVFTSSGYDVYVYFDSNQVTPNERIHTLSINGTTIVGKEEAANFSGTFTQVTGNDTNNPQVGNYAVFEGLTQSDFTLNAVAHVNGAGITGIQIVSVPEPSTWVLLVMGLASGAVLWQRRRG